MTIIVHKWKHKDIKYTSELTRIPAYCTIKQEIFKSVRGSLLVQQILISSKIIASKILIESKMSSISNLNTVVES